MIDNLSKIAIFFPFFGGDPSGIGSRTLHGHGLVVRWAVLTSIQKNKVAKCSDFFCLKAVENAFN